MMASLKVACVVVVMCMVVLAAPMAEAQAPITCDHVSNLMDPCLSYLMGGAPPPPPACCNGMRSLIATANTTVDRQTACGCLNGVVGSVPGINLGLAAGLPGECGVNVGYTISPTTNCNTVT